MARKLNVHDLDYLLNLDTKLTNLSKKNTNKHDIDYLLSLDKQLDDKRISEGRDPGEKIRKRTFKASERRGIRDPVMRRTNVGGPHSLGSLEDMDRELTEMRARHEATPVKHYDDPIKEMAMNYKSGAKSKKRLEEIWDMDDPRDKKQKAAVKGYYTIPKPKSNGDVRVTIKKHADSKGIVRYVSRHEFDLSKGSAGRVVEVIIVGGEDKQTIPLRELTVTTNSIIKEKNKTIKKSKLPEYFDGKKISQLTIIRQSKASGGSIDIEPLQAQSLSNIRLCKEREPLHYGR